MDMLLPLVLTFDGMGHPVEGLHTPLFGQTLGAVPEWQTPPEHVSFTVQALLSVQGTVLLVKTHPVAGLHVSVVQMLLSLQTTVVCVHALFVHPSVVQALLSLHEAGTMGVNTHPVAGLQVSVVQMLLSLQTMGVLMQAPVTGLHVSVVQALLSLQRISQPSQGFTGGIPITLKLTI
jgi:hypothetical protein